MFPSRPKPHSQHAFAQSVLPENGTLWYVTHTSKLTGTQLHEDNQPRKDQASHQQMWW